MAWRWVVYEEELTLDSVQQGYRKGSRGVIHKDKIYVEPRFLEVARARRV